MSKKCLFIFCILLLITIKPFAQTVVNADITDLRIYRDKFNGTITMNATNLPASFSSNMSGPSETLFWQIEQCNPCSLGSTFSTSFQWNFSLTENWVYSLYPNGTNGDTQVRFRLNGISKSIVLSPQILRRRNPVIFNSKASVNGSAEFWYRGQMVAVDNDINLSGTVKTNFFQYTDSNGRRKFDYKDITFSYAKSQK